MQLPTTSYAFLFALSVLTKAPMSHASPLPSSIEIPLSAHAPSPFSIPTRYESTVLGRRLLALSPTGVLSTIFPNDTDAASPLSLPPSSVVNTPISLPDYLADCEFSGNPTLLALGVSTSTKNAVAGSNVSLSLTWWDQYPLYTHRQPWSAAALPRLSIIGYLEEIPLKVAKKTGIEECYTRVHGDSRLWLPGDREAAHQGKWVRLVAEEVYWIGGFGDRAFIGWFDPKEWRGVKEEEWKAVRLPGEGKEEKDGL